MRHPIEINNLNKKFQSYRSGLLLDKKQTSREIIFPMLVYILLYIQLIYHIYRHNIPCHKKVIIKISNPPGRFQRSNKI